MSNEELKEAVERAIKSTDKHGRLLLCGEDRALIIQAAEESVALQERVVLLESEGFDELLKKYDSKEIAFLRQRVKELEKEIENK